MNTRLVKLLMDRGGVLEHADMLDCYNQQVMKNVSVTITTRIDHCNHYWVVEKVKYENKQ